VKDNNLILIVYYGRSGSIFAHSLLDGHPEIISLPPVFMYYIRDINNYLPELETAEQAYDYFIKIYGKVVNCVESVSSQNEVTDLLESLNINLNSAFDESVFKRLFFKFYNEQTSSLSDKHKLLFLTMHYAYDATLLGYQNIETAKQKKVLYQLHNPIMSYINWFAKRFDGLSLFQMIRSPLDTLRSTVKYCIEANGFTSGQMATTLKQILFGGTKFDSPNIDHFAVKLEDIHLQPELTLRRIAKRLNIRWDETLLCSSFSGLLWNNVKGREHISGFCAKPIHLNLSDVIPDRDIQFLMPRLMRFYQVWNYEFPIFKSSNLPNEHLLLLEYLVYIPDPVLATKQYNQQYNQQYLFLRSENIQFYFHYSMRFNQALVEVL